jgi:peptidoglycan hydrolase-like protein with peptidoglycan-binding domain
MTNKISFSILAALLAIAPIVASADTLYRQLQIGSSGSDVSALQTLLAGDPSLYPQGLVTGYYGFLTKAAVSNFQSRNGIPAVGRVGPATLPVLNLQMAGGTGTTNSASAPVITSVSTNASRNSATVTWATNELAQGVVYYSTSPLTTYENTNSVSVSGSTASTDSTLRSAQNVAISNLQANTTYYYLIYTTDQNGNVSVTWPSTFRTTN